MYKFPSLSMKRAHGYVPELWIDRRIPELEQYLLCNAYNPDITQEEHVGSLCEYAFHVIKGRWLEAEYYIFQDESSWCREGGKDRYLWELKSNYGIELTEQEARKSNPELLLRLEQENEVIE